MSFLGNSSNVTAIQWGVVIGASLVAVFTDVRTRRIPNTLTLPLAASGLFYAAAIHGLPGFGNAFAAMFLLASPYVLLFLFGGGGAGDAKMMGALGAWLGFEVGIVVLGCVAATGVLLGVLNLATKRQLAAGLGRIGVSFYVVMVALCGGRRSWALLKPELDDEPPTPDRRLTIPYGPAIFIGVCIGAITVHLWNG
jgi:Flp pilus assembly protein protease CpaA